MAIASGARKIVEIIGRHPALYLALPSLYLLLAYPPLWKDVDSLAQLIWAKGPENILHFPPLYCFTGRIPFWVGDCIQVLVTGRRLPQMNLWAGQNPSALGIELLIVVQHATFVGASSLLVRAAAKTAMSRGLIVLSFAAASALYAQQQCAASEAPSVTAIIFLTACGLFVLRKNDWRAWTLYTIALFLAIGTRHINIVLALWLPIALSGVLFWRILARQPIKQESVQLRPRATLLLAMQVSVALFCGAVAILADEMVARIMIAQVGQEYRSGAGYTLTDRIGAFLNRLPESERTSLVQRLVTSENDPVVRVAIAAAGKPGISHSEMGGIVRNALRQQGAPEQSLSARTDTIVLRAALTYFKTFHSQLLSTIISDFLHCYEREDNGELNLNPFLPNRSTARSSLIDPASWEPMKQLRSIDYPEAFELVDRAEADIYLMLWGPIPLIVLILIDIGVAALLVRRGKGVTAWDAGSLLVTSVLLYLANCVCAYFNDRYALPTLVCGVVALAIELGSWLEAV